MFLLCLPLLHLPLLGLPLFAQINSVRRSCNYFLLANYACLSSITLLVIKTIIITIIKIAKNSCLCSACFCSHTSILYIWSQFKLFRLLAQTHDNQIPYQRRDMMNNWMIPCWLQSIDRPTLRWTSARFIFLLSSVVRGLQVPLTQASQSSGIWDPRIAGWMLIH